IDGIPEADVARAVPGCGVTQRAGVKAPDGIDHTQPVGSKSGSDQTVELAADAEHFGSRIGGETRVALNEAAVAREPSLAVVRAEILPRLPVESVDMRLQQDPQPMATRIGDGAAQIFLALRPLGRKDLGVAMRPYGLGRNNRDVVGPGCSE